MPKEIVYGSESPYGPDESAESIVEVGWSREAGHVQLATRCIEASTHETYRPASPEPGTVVPDLSFHDGFYVQLDRRGINGLIRNLRRARDQAFGRDE